VLRMVVLQCRPGHKVGGRTTLLYRRSDETREWGGKIWGGEYVKAGIQKGWWYIQL
jgi:hypothetical protein